MKQNIYIFELLLTGGEDWDGSGQITYKGEYTENTLPVFSFSYRGVYSSSQFSSTMKEYFSIILAINLIVTHYKGDNNWVKFFLPTALFKTNS